MIVHVQKKHTRHFRDDFLVETDSSNICAKKCLNNKAQNKHKCASQIPKHKQKWKTKSKAETKVQTKVRYNLSYYELVRFCLAESS